MRAAYTRGSRDVVRGSCHASSTSLRYQPPSLRASPPARSQSVSSIGVGTVTDRAQLETVLQQQSFQTRAEAKAQKQTLFAGFWDAYYGLLRELNAQAQTEGEPGTQGERNDERVRQAFSLLYIARNRLALVATLYTIYYVDQMMGDAERMIDVPEGSAFVYNSHRPCTMCTI
jgi:hypothetical protein